MSIWRCAWRDHGRNREDTFRDFASEEAALRWADRLIALGRASVVYEIGGVETLHKSQGIA